MYHVLISMSSAFPSSIPFVFNHLQTLTSRWKRADSHPACGAGRVCPPRLLGIADEGGSRARVGAAAIGDEHVAHRGRAGMEARDVNAAPKAWRDFAGRETWLNDRDGHYGIMIEGENLLDGVTGATRTKTGAANLRPGQICRASSGGISHQPNDGV